MSKKITTVTVINRIPGEGCIFRAPLVTGSNDSAHAELPPRDMDLRPGVNTGIDRATVDYWRRHTAGLLFKRKGDTVTVSVDHVAGMTRDQLARARIANERERIAIERARIALARRSR
jgi:hypothetical protein